MRANRARWPIATMARLLGVSTSGLLRVAGAGAIKAVA